MSIVELLTVPEEERDVAWLKQSLRDAIKLEFATIPPYLSALWSIKDPRDSVAETIHEIVLEEMLHMGLACNMLVGLGEEPTFTRPEFVPSYPSSLPGDVNPDLIISLRRLTPSQLKVFMDIEYPEGGPLPTNAARAFDTIGEFYASIFRAFRRISFPLCTEKQRDVMFQPYFHLFKVETLGDVERAIDLIRRQGEGSKCTPEESPGHLAHFYQFREAYVGAQYIQNPTTRKWSHSGRPVVMSQVWPMADIPDRGYVEADVPYPAVWQQILEFDSVYTRMLRQLENVWRDPTSNFGDYQGSDPLLDMGRLRTIAISLIQNEQQQRPDHRGTYGPCFRLR